MALALLLILAIFPSLAVARVASCPTGISWGPESCTPRSDNGEILLHTNTRLTVSGGITDREDMEHRGATSAFELDHLGVAHLYRNSRDNSLSYAQQTTRAAQHSAWISYRRTLGKVLSNLETSRHSANGQLEETIDKFIANQAGSEDACHSQLLETKHQLNQLHFHVQDLSMQINATDHEVTALNNQVQSKLDEAQRLNEKCNQELEELENQQAEDLKFLDLLHGELEEMIQIANPDVTMNQSGSKVFAGGEAVESLLGSELQADAFRSFLSHIKLPSRKASGKSLRQRTYSASFVQMHVQKNGDTTKVQGDRDVLAGLRKAMGTAAHCMQDKKQFSLIHRKHGHTNSGHAKLDLTTYGHTTYRRTGATGTAAATTAAPQTTAVPDDAALPTSNEETGESPGTSETGSTGEAEGQELDELEEGEKELPDGEAMPPAKKVHCAASDFAKVQIGGLSGEVRPPRNLEKGEVAQVPCVQVNQAYFGVIWLTCNEELEASANQCLKAANATKCQEELEILQKVYVTTYVDLARLIQSYEEKTTDGYEASKKAIEDQCRDRLEPLQAEASKLASQSSEKVKQLEELRPKLEDALEAYHKLKAQVGKLTSQCKALPETITDLDKVRDAIKALSLCPGLNKSRLIVPKWIGTYTIFDEDYTKLSDSEYDSMMLEICGKTFGSEYPDKMLRAASVAEMQAHAVLELPQNNTADTPLIGPCPGCEGDEDEATSSGHLRVCWKAGAKLTSEERFMQCNQGQKSIACVIDGDK